MHVTGISFIRNAFRYDFPIVESLRSLLPLCDEVVVAVGNSDDDTLAVVRALDPKIRVIETVWDDSLREGGVVLAKETDKALAAVSPATDWIIYLQGDEVFHEQDYPAIRAAMTQFLPDKRIDGLLFQYRHFYGSYDYLGAARRWYRTECRVVRANIGVYSYRDAQGFRKPVNQKLNVKPIKAHVYHYGWVKPPERMQDKVRNFNRLWHTDDWIKEHVTPSNEFDYSEIDALERFTGTHPAAMHERIAQRNWRFDHDLTRNRLPLKDHVKRWLERVIGWAPGYKNYKVVR